MKRRFFVILVVAVMLCVGFRLAGSGKTQIKKSPYGPVVATLNGIYVLQGETYYGTEVVIIVGNTIVAGKNPYGTVLANITGNYIRKGNNRFAEIIATIDGVTIRKGEKPYGDILYKIDGPATTVEKGALAVAALRLDGAL